MDVAIEAAGRPETAKQCFAVVRKGGTVLFNGEPLPQYASADYRLADMDAYTVGAKFGHRTDRGEWSVRLEYYRQEGTPSPGSSVGELANYELILPMSAVIAQFGYRFKF